MSSPFWSFDPYILKMNFLFLMSLFFLSFPFFFMNMSTKMTGLLFFMKNTIKSLFPTLDFFSLGTLSALVSFFLFFSCVNLLSLISYVFSPLAHIMMTFILSLTMWTASMMYQLLFFLKNKAVHLTPKGTPLWLLFFMVLIELSSQVIRPITLGVRLAANLTAGHLILTLLASVSLFQSFFAQLPLVLLEVVVSLVQPFVFCLLVFLYFMET